MSSFHKSLLASINDFINFSHVLSLATITSTPRCFNNSSSPKNVLFSPITTLGIPYSKIVPEHIGQGDRDQISQTPEIPENSQEISANPENSQETSENLRNSQNRPEIKDPIEQPAIEANSSNAFDAESEPPTLVSPWGVFTANPSARWSVTTHAPTNLAEVIGTRDSLFLCLVDEKTFKDPDAKVQIIDGTEKKKFRVLVS